jgi:hypothetical protein
MRSLLKLLDRVGDSDAPRVQAAIAQRRRELEDQAATVERPSWAAGSSPVMGGSRLKQPSKARRRRRLEDAISLTDLGGA